MTTFNLTCQAVEATVPDYLDGTLEPWLRTSIEDHLAGCARCSNLVREIRNIAREASGLPRLFPEEDVWPRIAGRIGAPGFQSEPIAENPSLNPSSEEAEVISDLPMVSNAAVASDAAVIADAMVIADAPPSSSEPHPAASETAGLSYVEPVEHEVTLQSFEPFVETAASSAVEATEGVAFEREVPLPLSLPIAEPSVISPTSIVEPGSLEREVPVPPTELPIPVGSREVPATPVTPRTTTVLPLDGRRRRVLTLPRLTLSAAALVLVTAGTTFILTKHWLAGELVTNGATNTRTDKASSSQKARAHPAAEAPTAPSESRIPNALVQTPAHDQLPSAVPASSASLPAVARSPEDVVYDREIVGLEKIVRRQRRDLDASTIAEIDKNLGALDSAIGEIRALLRRDPGNSMLDDQSSHALEMKVELLRRAAMMRPTT